MFPPYDTCYHPLDKFEKSAGLFEKSERSLGICLHQGVTLAIQLVLWAALSSPVEIYLPTPLKLFLISNRKCMRKQFRKDEKHVSQRVKEG